MLLFVLPDIVFMRTWFTVQIPQFYNPVTSLLLPPEEKEKWRGMRTVGQLRHDLNIPNPANEDSIYKVEILLEITVFFL